MQSSIRDQDNKTPVLKTIVEAIGAEIPIIGVGQIITPDHAVEAMEKLNLPLIAVGRQLIAEPDWIEKVKAGKEDSIRTEIRPEDQEELAVVHLPWQCL